MKITILAVGQKMPKWVAPAYLEYEKRLPTRVKLIEIAAEKRTKNSQPQTLKDKEAERILKHIQPQDYVIALDERGQTWSTQQLAEQYQTWHDQNHNLCLLIGGPDGLAQTCLSRANATWSLGHLIYPHPLVRIILIEQLYRAYSICTNHPYHRA